MQIDSIYKTVQAILNKDQLGYLKPMHYNLFLRNAIRREYNNYLIELRVNVRKSNWHLDGKDMADYSQHIQQLLEYYSEEKEITKTTNFLLPNDLEYIEDVFYGNTRVEKVNYSDFKDLQSNNYAKATLCSPNCAKVGLSLKVSPNDINKISLHYLRKPKEPNWTFIEFQGKPMFNPTASDFQDVDAPETSYDNIISNIVEQASKMLRDLQLTQLENADQNQELQDLNRQ